MFYNERTAVRKVGAAFRDATVAATKAAVEMFVFVFLLSLTISLVAISIAMAFGGWSDDEDDDADAAHVQTPADDREAVVTAEDFEDEIVGVQG